MGIKDYFKNKKEDQLFDGLEQLYKKAKDMITKLEYDEADLVKYFEKEYPGIEADLNIVIDNLRKYFTAKYENKKLYIEHPELKEKFDQIDEAYKIDSIVKKCSTEKYRNPDVYNKNNAAEKMVLAESLVSIAKLAENPNASILSTYLKNSFAIYSNCGKLSLKSAVSHDLYELCNDASYMKTAIVLYYPYVNQAIDAYNEQLDLCLRTNSARATKNGYEYMSNLSTTPFENSKYPKLLRQVFDPNEIRNECQAKLGKEYKYIDSATM